MVQQHSRFLYPPTIQPVPVEARPKTGATALLTIPNICFISTSTVALVAGRLYYMPFMVRTPITVIGMTIEVTAASGAGTGVDVGIYRADTDWQPTSLVSDVGELLTDAIAVVSSGVLNIALVEGNYLIAMAAESTPTLRTVSGGVPFANPVLSVNLLVGGLAVAKLYGALADPGTLWDNPLYGNLFRYYVFLGVTP